MTPLGIRLNNPGNIEHGSPWEGLAANQDHPRFAAFIRPEYGIRAIARVLITYQDKRRARDGSRIDTVREIIERWAPPSENDSTSYAVHVRQRMGLDSIDAEIDVKDHRTMRGLVEAIIRHETGSMPYSDATIRKGLSLAGIDVPVKPLDKSTTITAGKVAAGGAIASPLVEPVMDLVEQIAPAMPLVETIGRYAPWALGALVLAAVGWMVWRRIEDQRLRVA